jgi:hypothetical protein
MRCPGQDQRYWTPKDIATIHCPACRREVEVWKDEPMRVCAGCGAKVRNPNLDLGCAEWCKYAEECLAGLKEDSPPETPPTSGR